MTPQSSQARWRGCSSRLQGYRGAAVMHHIPSNRLIPKTRSVAESELPFSPFEGSPSPRVCWRGREGEGDDDLQASVSDTTSAIVFPVAF